VGVRASRPHIMTPKQTNDYIKAVYRQSGILPEHLKTCARCRTHRTTILTEDNPRVLPSKRKLYGMCTSCFNKASTQAFGNVVRVARK
jgi:hypothetical protein